MRAVKGRDTKPEMTVRRYLFSRGLRFRVSNHRLPGSPDIVLRKYRTVVFIDGCFWHGHEGCGSFRIPKTNVDFWERKIRHNRARDISNTVVLQMAGWRVIRVWECDVQSQKRRASTLEAIYDQITGAAPLPRIELRPLLFNPGASQSEEPSSMAAEPAEGYGET